MAAPEFSEGLCGCCGGRELLHRASESERALCGTCTFMRALAVDVLADLRPKMGAMGAGCLISIDGKEVDVSTPDAVDQLARGLSDRYRDHGESALANWSGAIRFPELEAKVLG